MSETSIHLKKVRLAFPRLLKAEQVNGQGAPRFSAGLILESESEFFKANEEAILKAELAVAKAKWGEKAESMLRSLRLNHTNVLQDGNRKESVTGYAGNKFLNASSGSAQPPTLVRPFRTVEGVATFNRQTDEDEINRHFYGGAYVNAKISIWAQDNAYGKRINASLTGIQFAEHGIPFSGVAPASADEFEMVEPPSDWGDDGGDLV